MRSDHSTRALASPHNNDGVLQDVNDGSQYMDFGNIPEQFGDQSEYLSQYLVSGSTHPSETTSAGQEPSWDHEPLRNPHLDSSLMLDETSLPGWCQNPSLAEDHLPAHPSQLDVNIPNFAHPDMLQNDGNMSPNTAANFGRAPNPHGFMDGQIFVNNTDQHHSNEMASLCLADGDHAFPGPFNQHQLQFSGPHPDPGMLNFTNDGEMGAHKHDFDPTTRPVNGPLVVSVHNDDFEVEGSKNSDYFVTESSVMQTPVRGGRYPNSAESQDRTPFTDRPSLQGSPTYFMHGLQSPMDSASLQSPNVPFPNYVPGAGNVMVGRSNSMRRMHPMINSPRVQRSVSSASQMNSPSLGDIAEAPGEASPQTPGVRNRLRGQPSRSTSGSMVASRQLTPKGGAAPSALSSTYMIGDMDINADIDNHTHYIQPGSMSVSAAAAAAASMGFSPKKNPPADRPNASKRTSAGSATSASPTRTKRESRRRVTQDQIDHLEKVFSENPRPGPAERDRLAETIQLDVREVASWFHKRRLKDRAQASATEGPLKPGKQKTDRSGKATSGQSPDTATKEGNAPSVSREADPKKAAPNSTKPATKATQPLKSSSANQSEVSNSAESDPPAHQTDNGLRGFHSSTPSLPVNSSGGGHHPDMFVPSPMAFGNKPPGYGPPPWEHPQSGPIGMHRHMSTSNLPNHGSMHPAGHMSMDPNNQRPRPGLYRSSSFGYHQQLNHNGVPYPQLPGSDMRAGIDMNDSQPYGVMGHQFPAYAQADGSGAPEFAMGPYGNAMGPLSMGNVDMSTAINGGRPIPHRVGNTSTAFNANGKASPNQSARGKRRSAHARNASSTSNVNGTPEVFMRLSSGSGASDHSSSSSNSSNGPYGPPRQRSMSNYDSIENAKFSAAYSGNVTPFGPASRSNSIASVNSLSMYPPNIDPLESRQGSPDSQSTMRWPPYSSLSRSHSMVSMNPMDPGLPQYPGDMKRRRSLYGNPLPVQVRNIDESTGANLAPAQPMSTAGSLASSAAAAALRASNRRNSSGPVTRSRQSSFRLQLEEDNHAAHLVIYNNNDLKNQPRSQNSTTEGSQSRLNFPTNPESFFANQQTSPPEFNVNQAIQRLSSLRQHSPQRNTHSTWNGQRQS